MMMMINSFLLYNQPSAGSEKKPEAYSPKIHDDEELPAEDCRATHGAVICEVGAVVV